MSTKMLEMANLKAVAIEEDADVETLREIEFYALAFSQTPDKQGDVIAPGAVDEWLAKFYADGYPLPISFTHAAVRDTTNPAAFVGYAPADPEHVFKDDYGLRVRGYLFTGDNENARQVYNLTRRGLVHGASVAYTVHKERLVKDGPLRGSTLIEKMSIIEAGPCLDPANEDAFVIAVKSEEELGLKAVDNSEWDGDRAMGQCNSAADFGRIAFRRTGDSAPDSAAAWALPHHYLGQVPNPNARGVAAAIGALNGARGGAPSLRDTGVARSHLEAHQREIERAREASSIREYMTQTTTTADYNVTISQDELTKAGRKLSAANAAKVRAIRDLAEELLSLLEDVGIEPDGKANGEEPEDKANPEEPNLNAEHWSRLAAFEE